MELYNSIFTKPMSYLFPITMKKSTRLNGEKVYEATTVANKCILGVGLAGNEGTESLTDYGHFKEEALNIKPDFQPKIVTTDGWEHTQRVWKDLFPGIAVILCFLHAFLNIRDRSKRHKKQLRSISEKVWDIYHAETIVSFSQRIRRLLQWASVITIYSVQDKVLKLCD
jgi:hypothetical protein